MFHVFFAVNYWITNDVFRNKEYPIFATTVVVSVYQFFILLFIYDLIFFQVYNKRNLVIDDSKIVGFTVITILLFMNFYYFKSKKVKKILNHFNELERSSQIMYKLFSIVLMLLIIASTIYMSYSIRNNIQWW